MLLIFTWYQFELTVDVRTWPKSWWTRRLSWHGKRNIGGFLLGARASIRPSLLKSWDSKWYSSCRIMNTKMSGEKLYSRRLRRTMHSGYSSRNYLPNGNEKLNSDLKILIQMFLSILRLFLFIRLWMTLLVFLTFFFSFVISITFSSICYQLDSTRWLIEWSKLFSILIFPR